MQPAPNAANTQPLPERVGRYEVLLPIASGGMATVYLARTLGVGGFEREVALKVTHAHLRQNRDFALDLIEEAKLAVRIRHPNVVSVLDVGEDPLGLFLVMDYVEGDTLASLSRAAATAGAMLPVRIGLRVLVDVLSGLHAAHELHDEAGRPVNLVHRDFSPQNILLGMDGNARLTDFGIAKAATRLGHTTTGVIKGKLGYMSPEQARGQPLDRRCDIWAAGVVAWEVCTGRNLYDTENEAATLLRIVSERPPPARSVSLDIPDELDRVIASALTLERQQRCPNALTFARQLASVAQAHELLADVEEVAACVDELIAPRIERRRAKIQQVLELRSRSVPILINMPPAKGPSPATPAIAGDHDEAAQRAATTGPTTSAQDSPALARSTLTRFALLAAGAGLVLIVALLWSRARTQTPAAAAPLPQASEPATPSVPIASGPPAPEPSAAPAPEFMMISSDVPVRSVEVEGRPLPISPPSRSIGVQVSSEELSRGVSIEAVSVDGRTTRAISEAGQHAVSLRFASGRGPATMVTATATGKLPFAPNPYSSPR